jgi:hypothetical protein
MGAGCVERDGDFEEILVVFVGQLGSAMGCEML